MKNYCVCVKGKRFLGKASIVRKGDKFWYEVDKIGDTLGNRQITFHLYGMNTGRHRFSIDKTTFGKYFVDIIEFREKQIDQILE